ncbi:MAG: flagellar M-ring protein FliF [Candidatus Melainabacteria bacterium RIFCSPHIGHO2_02_FULL_34_12]|nr:MAG: flagellar M-ring protein FliF [Candidatus Melainabacteria bacterium RIFCSPHIGHO2_02_FULL_34_12]
MATEQTQLRAPNVQEAFNNLGQNRKMVMVGAGIVTIVIAVLIVVFAWSKGTSKGGEIDLVKSIDQDRAFEVVTKLKANEIDGKISDSDLPGKVNVKVYQKEFDKAAITLARSDLLQEDGFNLFDKSDWAASDYDKRIKMMRAVNGDLSRIVSRMTGIKWSTVRVSIPEPQLFNQFQSPTTATVQVELAEVDSKLSRVQVRSVINLLVGYVPNLQKNSISIIDTNGITYSAVETEEMAASELLEESEKVNKIVQKRIEEYLSPLLGLSNFIVRVSSDISRRKIEENATTFADGVVGQEQIGDERLGQDSEGAATGPAISGGDKNYIRSNRITQKYPSFKQKSISTPPGRITKISVAVALNSDVLPRVSVKQLKEGIAAITSPTTSVDDVVINVTEFASSKTRKTAAANAPVLPNFGGFIEQVISYVKNLPRWVTITVGIIAFLMFIGSFRRPAVPPQTQSTISQINQAMQQNQLPRQGAQTQEQLLEQQRQQLTAQQPDLGGIISGLKEAASEKPEFLASKLQIWLEEGTAAGRI